MITVSNENDEEFDAYLVVLNQNVQYVFFRDSKFFCLDGSILDVTDVPFSHNGHLFCLESLFHNQNLLIVR